MQEEFGAGIKFSLAPWPQHGNVSSSESEDEMVPTKEVNLLYSGETIGQHQARTRRDKEIGVADGKESVDSFWLQKQVCGCW